MLLVRLTTADLICSDCGNKYGKYSVGCSSFHIGTCEVCGKTAPVTEVRDFGYLQNGICAEKLRVKQQSKGVADYIAILNQADFIVTDPDNIDELVMYATRNSMISKDEMAEGIVIRTINEKLDMQMAQGFGNGRFSFKVINPEYLLKHGG